MEPAASMEPGSSVPHGNLSAYFPDLDEFDVAKASRLIFEQEYISVFEGFTDEMRKAFLNCEGGFVRGGAPAVATRKHAARLRPRNADDMFARVDKNLKMHLQTRATKPPFKAFVGALEDFLLEVIENPDDHDLEAQQRPPLRAALVRKVRVIEGQRPSDESAPAERAAVELVFKTGLHRLLTHGLCQFHGLQSKSVTEPGTELRALRVSPPRADSNVLGWSTVERAPNDDGGVEDLLFGEKVFRLDQYLGALAAGEQIAK